MNNLTVDNIQPVEETDRVFDLKTVDHERRYPEKTRNKSVLKPIDYLSLKRFEPYKKPLSNHSNYSYQQDQRPQFNRDDNIFA